LRCVIRAVDVYSRKLIAEHGLSGPQLMCLRQLDARPLLTGRLAKAISLSPATVCGILDRLEARGLVARERQVDDKRRIVVRLTGAGRDAVRRAPPALQERFLFRFRALPASQQAALNQTLKALVAMMAADDVDLESLLGAPELLGAASGRLHGLGGVPKQGGEPGMG
jgi:DNA-binding MarR family transcriptional regulator